MHIGVHSPTNKYLLNTYYAPGTVLHTWLPSTAVNKAAIGLYLQEINKSFILEH